MAQWLRSVATSVEDSNSDMSIHDKQLITPVNPVPGSNTPAGLHKLFYIVMHSYPLRHTYTDEIKISK